MHVNQKDYLLFFNDLQAKGPSDEASLAEFIGLCSAACNRPVEASLVIPGVLRLSGSMDELKGLEDILRVAKNAGAKKVLLPLGCIKDLQSVPPELLGSVSPDFYPDGDAVAAARKALGIWLLKIGDHEYELFKNRTACRKRYSRGVDENAPSFAADKRERQKHPGAKAPG